jgi:hypothetical protein
VDIEFEEPWSQPGFLQLTVISGMCTSQLGQMRVLKALQGLRRDREQGKPTLALGGTRRCLIQPVVKA